MHSKNSNLPSVAHNHKSSFAYHSNLLSYEPAVVAQWLGRLAAEPEDAGFRFVRALCNVSAW